MSIGLRIAITGLILTGGAMLVSTSIGGMTNNAPLAIAIVASFFGGIAAIVIGAVMAVWGV